MGRAVAVRLPSLLQLELVWHEVDVGVQAECRAHHHERTENSCMKVGKGNDRQHKRRTIDVARVRSWISRNARVERKEREVS